MTVLRGFKTVITTDAVPNNYNHQKNFIQYGFGFSASFNGFF